MRVGWGDLGVDWRIILKWLFKKWGWDGGGMDWIAMAQDRNGWCAVMIAVMNLSGSIKCGEFFDKLRTFKLLKRTLLHGVSLL